MDPALSSADYSICRIRAAFPQKHSHQPNNQCLVNPLMARNSWDALAQDREPKWLFSNDPTRPVGSQKLKEAETN